MLRRDMFKLGLLSVLPDGDYKPPTKLPKRPPKVTLRREKQKPLSYDELDDNMMAIRALIERLEWSDE